MKENKITIKINIANILIVVFVALKLIGKISWSWWWVLSPIWIGWGITIALMVIQILLENKS